MYEYLWIILSLASAVFFGIKDILAKNFLKLNKVSPRELVFHEYFILFFFVTLVFFTKIDFLSITELWNLYIFKAFAVGMATFLYFSLLEKYQISLVSPLINLSPFFLLFLSSIFLGEIITLYHFVGVLILMIATYFLEITVHHHQKDNPHKFHLIDLNNKDYKFFFNVIILLFIFSFAAIADKLLLDQINVFTNMFFTSFFILVALFIYYYKKGRLKSCFKILKSSRKIYYISIFTIISNFLVLFAIAIPGALVSLIIPLRRTSTLFSAIFGGIVFHEKHLWKKFFAICLMLIGVLFIVF